MSTDHPPTPHERVMQLLMGKLAGQALTQIAELGVADELAHGPRTAAHLAEALDANEDALYRTMRALAAMGFFTESPGRVFANNANSETLRSAGPGSLRAFARWIGEETSWWKAWGNLSYSLRTGRPGAELAFDGTTFEFLGRNPRVTEVFQGAMSDLSAAAARAVAEAYDFGGLTRIVDVGGGHGTLLAAILSSQPDATGTLFDLPEVIAGAGAALEATGLSGRIQQVAGDFFEGVPAGADAYLLKHIIHDWDDDRCIRLLEHCRRGLNPGGRILIIEQVLGDGPGSVQAKLADLEMLVMTPGGRERTGAEFARLLRRAGLEMQRIVLTGSPVCVVEAFITKASPPGADAIPAAGNVHRTKQTARS
ncbi:MAG: methyltransferase [Verrucomicrobiales bacterium]|nr:methyltransferase [Verrucomicrobiales bacterium]